MKTTKCCAKYYLLPPLSDPELLELPDEPEFPDVPELPDEPELLEEPLLLTLPLELPEERAGEYELPDLFDVPDLPDELVDVPFDLTLPDPSPDDVVGRV